VEGEAQYLAIVPSNQFFKSHTIATLRLLNQELFFIGVVCALVSPSQDCFHDYGR
jgi:hypothetical protein